MDATLDCHPDQCPCTEEALLSAPCWSTYEIGQDVSYATEGLHLRKQLC
jgi:hypothetical protein